MLSILPCPTPELLYGLGSPKGEAGSREKVEKRSDYKILQFRAGDKAGDLSPRGFKTLRGERSPGHPLMIPGKGTTG
jgi:hypothetical protein